LQVEHIGRVLWRRAVIEVSRIWVIDGGDKALGWLKRRIHSRNIEELVSQAITILEQRLSQVAVKILEALRNLTHESTSSWHKNIQQTPRRPESPDL